MLKNSVINVEGKMLQPSQNRFVLVVTNPILNSCIKLQTQDSETFVIYSN